MGSRCKSDLLKACTAVIIALAVRIGCLEYYIVWGAEFSVGALPHVSTHSNMFFYVLFCQHFVCIYLQRFSV